MHYKKIKNNRLLGEDAIISESLKIGRPLPNSSRTGWFKNKLYQDQMVNELSPKPKINYRRIRD